MQSQYKRIENYTIPTNNYKSSTNAQQDMHPHPPLLLQTQNHIRLRHHQYGGAHLRPRSIPHDLELKTIHDHPRQPLPLPRRVLAVGPFLPGERLPSWAAAFDHRDIDIFEGSVFVQCLITKLPEHDGADNGDKDEGHEASNG